MVRKIFCFVFFLLNTSVIFADQPTGEGIRVYHKKEKIAEALDRYYNAGDLWSVLQHEFVLSHHETNPRVRQKMIWYYRHPDTLTRAMERAGPWLFFILQQTRKRHLPAELVLLPIIESAYNPFAQNATSGAAGIWQMMPMTASSYGIKQTPWYDGRRDIVASTKAALDHLAYLHGFFNGNWLLAIAAYDTGEGNVLAAIRKNIRRGDDVNFWSLPLAQETQDYVPRLLALAAIISHPESWPTPFPPVPNAPYLAEVKTKTPISLKQAANLAHLSPDKMKALNPAYTHTVPQAKGFFHLVIPITHIASFTDNLANLLRRHGLLPNHSPITIKSYTLQPGDTLYMVRRGDTLQKVAQRFHLQPTQILAVNHLPSQPLYKGQRLILPTHTLLAKNKKMTQRPDDQIYIVKPHDTIERVARAFNTTPAAIRLINFLPDNTLAEGDRLVIPAHV